MHLNSKIYVAGHTGMVGSAIVRTLELQGYTNLIFRTFEELDLTDQGAVETFFRNERPDYVFLAAAKVGGILANNTKRAEFIYTNLAIQTNVIHAAYASDAQGLLFLGSSCIYPRECSQPIKEEYLLGSPLEYTNEPYAVAKIAGLKMCEAYNAQYGTKFISAMPTNLYGPNDNFDLQSSHVLPALIRKFVEAKSETAPFVTVWGTGRVRREFLYVDDAASACVFLMKVVAEGRGNWSTNHINVGCGADVTINELARKIREVVGYEGDIRYDASKPDGTPRKLLDVSKLEKMGWSPSVTLDDGLRKTVQWYQQNTRS